MTSCVVLFDSQAVVCKIYVQMGLLDSQFYFEQFVKGWPALA